MKSFLFIAGCPRSGTSALAHLVSGSEEIIMGMERFGHLVSAEDFKLTPEHFSKDRFFDVREEDTFYNDFDKFHSFDKNIYSKFDAAKIVGDKRPDLYLVYDQLFDKFKDAKLIFIYRNVEDVASSYQGRVAAGNNWPASKDFSKAVLDWNRSLYFTREAIKKGYSVGCVSYDDVFLSDSSLAPLFDYIDVEMTDSVNIKIAEIRTIAKRLSEKRVTLLSDSEKEYVNSNAKSFLIGELEPYNILKITSGP